MFGSKKGRKGPPGPNRPKPRGPMLQFAQAKDSDSSVLNEMKSISNEFDGNGVGTTQHGDLDEEELEHMHNLAVMLENEHMAGESGPKLPNGSSYDNPSPLSASATQSVAATSIAPKQPDGTQAPMSAASARPTQAAHPKARPHPPVMQTADGEFPGLVPTQMLRGSSATPGKGYAGAWTGARAGVGAHSSAQPPPPLHGGPPSHDATSSASSSYAGTASSGPARTPSPATGMPARAPSPAPSSGTSSLSDAIALRKELALMRKKARVARDDAEKARRAAAEAQREIEILNLRLVASETDMHAAVQEAKDQAEVTVQKATSAYQGTMADLDEATRGRRRAEKRAAALQKQLHNAHARLQELAASSQKRATDESQRKGMQAEIERRVREALAARAQHGSAVESVRARARRRSSASGGRSPGVGGLEELEQSDDEIGAGVGGSLEAGGALGDGSGGGVGALRGDAFQLAWGRMVRACMPARRGAGPIALGGTRDAEYSKAQAQVGTERSASGLDLLVAVGRGLVSAGSDAAGIARGQQDAEAYVSFSEQLVHAVRADTSPLCSGRPGTLYRMVWDGLGPAKAGDGGTGSGAKRMSQEEMLSRARDQGLSNPGALEGSTRESDCAVNASSGASGQRTQGSSGQSMQPSMQSDEGSLAASGDGHGRDQDLSSAVRLCAAVDRAFTALLACPGDAPAASTDSLAILRRSVARLCDALLAVVTSPSCGVELAAAASRSLCSLHAASNDMEETREPAAAGSESDSDDSSIVSSDSEQGGDRLKGRGTGYSGGHGSKLERQRRRIERIRSRLDGSSPVRVRPSLAIVGNAFRRRYLHTALTAAAAAVPVAVDDFIDAESRLFHSSHGKSPLEAPAPGMRAHDLLHATTQSREGDQHWVGRAAACMSLAAQLVSGPGRSEQAQRWLFTSVPLMQPDLLPESVRPAPRLNASLGRAEPSSLGLQSDKGLATGSQRAHSSVGLLPGADHSQQDTERKHDALAVCPRPDTPLYLLEVVMQGLVVAQRQTVQWTRKLLSSIARLGRCSCSIVEARTSERYACEVLRGALMKSKRNSDVEGYNESAGSGRSQVSRRLGYGSKPMEDNDDSADAGEKDQVYSVAGDGAGASRREVPGSKRARPAAAPSTTGRAASAVTPTKSSFRSKTSLREYEQAALDERVRELAMQAETDTEIIRIVSAAQYQVSDALHATVSELEAAVRTLSAISACVGSTAAVLKSVSGAYAAIEVKKGLAGYRLVRCLGWATCLAHECEWLVHLAERALSMPGAKQQELALGVVRSQGRFGWSGTMGRSPFNTGGETRAEAGAGAGDPVAMQHAIEWARWRGAAGEVGKLETACGAAVDCLRASSEHATRIQGDVVGMFATVVRLHGLPGAAMAAGVPVEMKQARLYAQHAYAAPSLFPGSFHRAWVQGTLRTAIDAAAGHIHGAIRASVLVKRWALDRGLTHLLSKVDGPATRGPNGEYRHPRWQLSTRWIKASSNAAIGWLLDPARHPVCYLPESLGDESGVPSAAVVRYAKQASRAVLAAAELLESCVTHLTAGRIAGMLADADCEDYASAMGTDPRDAAAEAFEALQEDASGTVDGDGEGDEDDENDDDQDEDEMGEPRAHRGRKGRKGGGKPPSSIRRTGMLRQSTVLPSASASASIAASSSQSMASKLTVGDSRGISMLRGAGLILASEAGARRSGLSEVDLQRLADGADPLEVEGVQAGKHGGAVGTTSSSSRVKQAVQAILDGRVGVAEDAASGQAPMEGTSDGYGTRGASAGSRSGGRGRGRAGSGAAGAASSASGAADLFKGPFEFTGQVPPQHPLLVEPPVAMQLRLVAESIRCSASMSCSAVQFGAWQEVRCLQLHAALLQVVGAIGQGVPTAEVPAARAKARLEAVLGGHTAAASAAAPSYQPYSQSLLRSQATRGSRRGPG